MTRSERLVVIWTIITIGWCLLFLAGYLLGETSFARHTIAAIRAYVSE